MKSKKQSSKVPSKICALIHMFGYDVPIFTEGTNDFGLPTLIHNRRSIKIFIEAVYDIKGLI